MIEFIKENYETFGAIIGGLYVVARMIVALTPTPKDDKALDKIGGWLKAISKIAGLDLTQGVHTKED